MIMISHVLYIDETDKAIKCSKDFQGSALLKHVNQHIKKPV